MFDELTDITEVSCGTLHVIDGKDFAVRAAVFLEDGRGYWWYPQRAWNLPFDFGNTHPSPAQLQPLSWKLKNGAVHLTFGTPQPPMPQTVILRRSNWYGSAWSQINPDNPHQFMRYPDHRQFLVRRFEDYDAERKGHPYAVELPPGFGAYRGPMTRSRTRQARAVLSG